MKSVLTAVALIFGAVLIIWGGMHISIPRINPEQPTPAGHFSFSCGVCHIVSNSAPIVTD